jgi:hypothetical protein
MTEEIKKLKSLIAFYEEKPKSKTELTKLKKKLVKLEKIYEKQLRWEKILRLENKIQELKTKL